ncbi:MAG: hypothetical protein ACLTEH_02300 [Clostridia bacterium]
MEKNTTDYNNFYGFSGYPPFEGMENGYVDNPMFNPMLQYEQAYMYYRYMTQQLDYKIKCKEYEKLCNITRPENRAERRID